MKMTIGDQTPLHPTLSYLLKFDSKNMYRFLGTKLYVTNEYL